MTKKLPYDTQLDEFLLAGVQINNKHMSKQYLDAFFHNPQYDYADGCDSLTKFDSTIIHKLVSMDYPSLIQKGYGAGVVGYWNSLSSHIMIPFDCTDEKAHKKYYKSCESLRVVALEHGELKMARETNENSNYSTKSKQKHRISADFHTKIIDAAVLSGDIDTAELCLWHQLQGYSPDFTSFGFPRGSEDYKNAQERDKNLKKEFAHIQKTASQKTDLPRWMQDIKDNFIPVDAQKINAPKPSPSA